MINLKIYEENNNLIFKENYAPIVCGNSNYEITFEFGSDWQSVNNKTAIIVANGQKTAIDFSGSTLTLPAIPNCNNFMLIIFPSEGETTRLVSSPIEIAATPTSYAESLPEFAPLTTYVSELLTKINNLIDGTTKVKTAEKADVATSAQNVSNPNLLLNGDFKINQRGKTSYTCTKNEYTVDRWLGANGLTVTASSNSISLSNTNSSGTVIFQQKLEEPFLSFAGKTLCISATVDGNLYYASAQLPTATPTIATTLMSKQIADGVTLQLAYLATNMLSAQISLATGKTITLTNAKLELGSSPTVFCSRPYAEELALCQRFYFSLTSNIKYGTFSLGSCITRTINNEIYNCTFHFPIHTPITLRTNPTITLNSKFCLACKGEFKSGLSQNNMIFNLGYSYNNKLIGVTIESSSDLCGYSATLRSDDTQVDSPASINFDSEIY